MSLLTLLLWLIVIAVVASLLLWLVDEAKFLDPRARGILRWALLAVCVLSAVWLVLGVAGVVAPVRLVRVY